MFAVPRSPKSGSSRQGGFVLTLAMVRMAGHRMVRVTVKALHRKRQRQQLLTLCDRRLRDIGVSRAEAEQEAAKPFWRS